MEPRWYEEWQAQGFEFLGGNETYDYWLDNTLDFRICRGNGSNNWDWFSWHGNRKKFLWGSNDMVSNMNEEEIRKIVYDMMLYLKIFAPWAIQKATKARTFTFVEGIGEIAVEVEP